jgi:hypothetical protein
MRTGNRVPYYRLRGGQGLTCKQIVPWGNATLWALGLTLAAVLILIGFTPPFAAEKGTAVPVPSPRVPEMSAAGTVKEITVTHLKIERTLKGKAELMEFVLEKPFPDVAVGEQVKVSYLEKEGRNILIRMAPAQKTAVKKGSKKDFPNGMKPAAPVAPAGKSF